jgi:hypothetical protein
VFDHRLLDRLVRKKYVTSHAAALDAVHYYEYHLSWASHLPLSWADAFNSSPRWGCFFGRRAQLSSHGRHRRPDEPSFPKGELKAQSISYFLSAPLKTDRIARTRNYCRLPSISMVPANALPTNLLPLQTFGLREPLEEALRAANTTSVSLLWEQPAKRMFS